MENSYGSAGEPPSEAAYFVANVQKILAPFTPTLLGVPLICRAVMLFALGGYRFETFMLICQPPGKAPAPE